MYLRHRIYEVLPFCILTVDKSPFLFSCSTCVMITCMLHGPSIHPAIESHYNDIGDESYLIFWSFVYYLNWFCSPHSFY